VGGGGGVGFCGLIVCCVWGLGLEFGGGVWEVLVDRGLLGGLKLSVVPPLFGRQRDRFPA